MLNISFAAVRQVDDKDVYLSKNHIKEQIYRRLDLLKNLSAVTVGILELYSFSLFEYVVVFLR